MKLVQPHDAHQSVTLVRHELKVKGMWTHYMNFVATLVPHGKLSFIDLSNVLPNTTSSAVRSSKNLPIYPFVNNSPLLWLAFPPFPICHKQTQRTFDNNPISHPSSPVLLKVLFPIPFFMIPCIILHKDPDVPFKTWGGDGRRRGGIDGNRGGGRVS